jgi:hypothetical protein
MFDKQDQISSLLGIPFTMVLKMGVECRKTIREGVLKMSVE